MAESQSCRTCGKPIPADAPLGHCPKCLVALGVGRLPETPSPSEPVRFGDYELVEVIGRGGMGVVHKARQLSLKRLVALKRLGPFSAAFPRVAARIRLEAEAAGSLNHPHIVTIYEVGEHNGQPFFTMELVEGVGLDRHIIPNGFCLETATSDGARRSGPQASAARLLAKIARAVDYAHKHGVLHRDLKPANVVVDQAGEPHLTDFGLAKVIGYEQTMTPDSAVFGTPGYMAPEQAAGENKRVSTAADIYGLGAILYAMLTGHPPFRAETPVATLRQVVEDVPKPPTTLNAAIDRELATICLKCLEKEPARRYASALALAEDLERWLRREPIEARPVRALGRVWRWCRREPVLSGMAAGIILLLAATTLLTAALYQREKRSGIEKEQRSDSQRQAQVDRIEAERRRNEPAIDISAEEVATIARRPLTIDAPEQRILLALVAEERLQDRIARVAGLTHCLQTSLWNQAQIPALFNLRLYRSRAAAAEGMRHGDADLYLVDPAIYVLARQGNTPLMPLVRQKYNGTAELRGAIVTRTNSSISSLRDLKGKTLVFGEEDSAIGWYLPRAALAEAGLHSRDLAQVTNLPSSTALSAVRRGLFDAAVVIWTDLELLGRVGVRFRVLQELRSPSPVWVVRAKLDAKTREALRKAFLSVSEPSILAGLDDELTGFLATSPSEYDPLEQEIKRDRWYDEP